MAILGMKVLITKRMWMIVVLLRTLIIAELLSVAHSERGGSKLLHRHAECTTITSSHYRSLLANFSQHTSSRFPYLPISQVFALDT